MTGEFYLPGAACVGSMAAIVIICVKNHKRN